MWQIASATASTCDRRRIAYYGRSAGAAVAGNTGLEQPGRFQKTADYRRIADRVPSGGSDSMAET